MSRKKEGNKNGSKRITPITCIREGREDNRCVNLSLQSTYSFRRAQSIRTQRQAGWLAGLLTGRQKLGGGERGRVSDNTATNSTRSSVSSRYHRSLSPQETHAFRTSKYHITRRAVITLLYGAVRRCIVHFNQQPRRTYEYDDSPWQQEPGVS